MVTNLARKLAPVVVVTEQVGSVISVDGSEALVQIGPDRVVARRAVSCLVEPIADDEVLVGVRSDGRCHILAVLEREDAAVVITAEADLSIRVRKGRFTVAAQEGVDLASAKDVRVTAARLGVVAADADVTLERMSYVGRLLDAHIERVKTVATTLDSVAERLSQRVRRSFRKVEELDSVRAARIDVVASESLRTHAQTQLMTATELIKLDGEQIHLG